MISQSVTRNALCKNCNCFDFMLKKYTVNILVNINACNFT